MAKGGWDYALVDALQPRPEDIVLPKPRYSVFFNTGASARWCSPALPPSDGFFLEYFGVVLDDATHYAGPEFVREASLYNIEKFFGWVSSTADFRGAITQTPLTV